MFLIILNGLKYTTMKQKLTDKEAWACIAFALLFFFFFYAIFWAHFLITNVILIKP